MAGCLSAEARKSISEIDRLAAAGRCCCRMSVPAVNSPPAAPLLPPLPPVPLHPSLPLSVASIRNEQRADDCTRRDAGRDETDRSETAVEKPGTVAASASQNFNSDTTQPTGAPCIALHSRTVSHLSLRVDRHRRPPSAAERSLTVRSSASTQPSRHELGRQRQSARHRRNSAGCNKARGGGSARILPRLQQPNGGVTARRQWQRRGIGPPRLRPVLIAPTVPGQAQCCRAHRAVAGTGCAIRRHGAYRRRQLARAVACEDAATQRRGHCGRAAPKSVRPPQCISRRCSRGSSGLAAARATVSAR